MRTALFAAAALAAALLGPGCTVGPRFSPPAADAPAAWRAAQGGPATPSVVTQAPLGQAEWWTSFNDPELAALETRALGANLDLRQAVLRIEQAREQARVAGAAAWPNVTASTSATHQRLSERTPAGSLLGTIAGIGSGGRAPGGGLSPQTSSVFQNPFEVYQFGAGASWEIDLFGRIRRQTEAARAEAEAAAEDRHAVQVALMAEVAATYIDLRSAQARRAVAEQDVATAAHLLKLAQDARAAQLGSDFDAAGAQAALASSRAELPPLDQLARVDKDHLAVLLALKPGELDAELDAEPGGQARPPPLPAAVPAGLPSELARRRPDIRAAEAQLHAAVARQGVAVAMLYPSLSLTGSAGYQAGSTSALTDWAARYATIGPAIDLPIFDAGQRRANIRIADAGAKAAALAYAQTVLAALQETEDAISGYQQEQLRLAELDAAVAEARRALDLAQGRFHAGSVSFRDVLDAQSRLQQAEMAWTASRAAAAENLVALYRALGGGWS
jgi:NodT family efflux transporter outer membrane factor (OMF) lipoprotein